MKSAGIVRRIDQLGRIVLPMELRRTYKITEHEPISFYVDGDSIVLKKYQPTCVLCGEVGSANEYKGKMVCDQCRAQLETEVRNLA
jgi:transcriptional pleiotropic regulator of transition state genes